MREIVKISLSILRDFYNMLIFPKIDPVLFQIGPLAVHWYGMMYLFAFGTAWGLARWRTARYELPWTKEQISDLVFYCALGAVLGGRIGYMVFYQTATLLHDPLTLFYIWHGGMSFHGGLLGVLLAIGLFARKAKKPFFEVTDFIVPMVPVGLGFGRLGNFINGELWGRVTEVPWAFVFPHVDRLPRHPSQLYELCLEGVFLFIVLWCYAAKPRPVKATSGLFLLLYGVCRFLVEFFREPDKGLGFIAFDWMSMGQLLSLPMIMIGGAIMGLAYCYKPKLIKTT